MSEKFGVFKKGGFITNSILFFSILFLFSCSYDKGKTTKDNLKYDIKQNNDSNLEATVKDLEATVNNLDVAIDLGLTQYEDEALKGFKTYLTENLNILKSSVSLVTELLTLNKDINKIDSYDDVSSDIKELVKGCKYLEFFNNISPHPNFTKFYPSNTISTICNPLLDIDSLKQKTYKEHDPFIYSITVHTKTGNYPVSGILRLERIDDYKNQIVASHGTFSESLPNIEIEALPINKETNCINTGKFDFTKSIFGSPLSLYNDCYVTLGDPSSLYAIEGVTENNNNPDLNKRSFNPGIYLITIEPFCEYGSLGKYVDGIPQYDITNCKTERKFIDFEDHVIQTLELDYNDPKIIADHYTINKKFSTIKKLEVTVAEEAKGHHMNITIDIPDVIRMSSFKEFYQKNKQECLK